MNLSQFERKRLREVLEQLKDCEIPNSMEVSGAEFRFFFTTVQEWIDDEEVKESTRIRSLL